LLLSQKYKQLTNQLQFDYDSSLTMNRRDSKGDLTNLKDKPSLIASVKKV